VAWQGSSPIPLSSRKRAVSDNNRATDAHFRPDKPWGATGKSLIVLNLWLTLNQQVFGFSSFR
jgi:hypothetical protein